MSDAQPVLAYYCKYYAVSMALKGGPNKFQRTPETDAFLAKLFDDLEEEKSKLSHHSTIKDLTQGAIYVRELAYRIFLSAEKQESSPETLKKSLQSFSAALNFLQVYRGIFLEDPAALDLSEEERTEELRQVEEKSKFAKWRVVEIKKQLLLLNNTSSPTASTPVSPVSHANTNVSQSQAQSPTYHNTQSPINHNSNTQSPIAHISNTQSPQVSPVLPDHQPQPHSHLPGHHQPPQSQVLLYDPKILSECERQARHAISALNFDDVETAAENLRTALRILQPLLKENK